VVPNAVTVVPLNAFGLPIDSRVITRVNPQTLVQVRPTLDPLLLTPLRNAALHSAWGRGKIDLPPGIAKKLVETRVITSVTPATPPFGKNLARALRVEPVPDKVKRQELKFRDDRHGPDASNFEQQEAARKQQLTELGKQAAQGNKDARRQMHELEQQQRQQQKAVQDAQRAAAQQQRAQQKQQAQGERVGNREQPRVATPRPEPPRAKPRVEFKGPPIRQNVERPQVMRQQAPPQRVQPQPQVMRQQPKQQQQAAPAKQGNPNHGPPAQPPGGGKGKKPKN
jgi:hypothetical protein